MMIRAFKIVLFLSALSLAACDEHVDFPDTSIKIGHVLCSDGSTMSVEQCDELGKIPVAVVFHVSHDSLTAGDGYAVYLRDIYLTRLADSLGVEQGTSASLTLYDGNANSYAMFSCKEVGSPAADIVFGMWYYGQSAYLPSVAEMRLLYAVKDEINPILVHCGGDALADMGNASWYWTSTEVQGQSAYKAWLYSMSSGAIQETPKYEPHYLRPIMTLNR